MTDLKDNEQHDYTYAFKWTDAVHQCLCPTSKQHVKVSAVYLQAGYSNNLNLLPLWRALMEAFRINCLQHRLLLGDHFR